MPGSKIKPFTFECVEECAVKFAHFCNCLRTSEDLIRIKHGVLGRVVGLGGFWIRG